MKSILKLIFITFLYLQCLQADNYRMSLVFFWNKKSKCFNPVDKMTPDIQAQHILFNCHYLSPCGPYTSECQLISLNILNCLDYLDYKCLHSFTSYISPRTLTFKLVQEKKTCRIILANHKIHTLDAL